MTLYITNLALSLAISLLIVSSLPVDASQLSLSTEHDGIAGPSSSQMHYDEKSGLSMKGPINDILGPPIKIANGFNTMLEGSKMAGLGTSLKTGGAVLGFDAKLMEALGGAHLLKGGLLLGGSALHTGEAAALHGPVGKKISSIIEVPVKVVAMKDIAAGKTLAGIGKVKKVEALAVKAKGANMIKEGDAMKQQGFAQIMQGASDGMQNIGNMVQQTSENLATAYKLLPIMLDLPTGQQPQQQTQEPIQQQVQQQEATKTQQPYPQPQLGAGNSLFGGLSSLIPGMGQNDPLFGLGNIGNTLNGANRQPFNLFGQPGQPGHNGYAALLNATHPFANLLMNPGLNPLLMPMAGGPLGQSIMSKAPAASANYPPGGLGALGFGGEQKFNYNLLPGIRVSETTSSRLPSGIKGMEVQHPIQQQQQQQVVLPQQQQQEQTSVKN